MQSIEERFWAKVQPTGFCWEWTASKAHGYGYFNGSRAHRFAYELLVGPIPDGLVIDHLCRNRGCVNPDHLEPVTQRENTMRGYSFSRLHARKTHCIRGHEFTPENTKTRSNGARICRECMRLHALRQNARRRHGITLEI